LPTSFSSFFFLAKKKDTFKQNSSHGCIKTGNARQKLLAYPSFACIQTMQNSKIHFAQFPME